jgi:hypothetical protein
MLDQPQEGFAAEDRLALMVLGLLSTSGRVAHLSVIPRTDGQPAPVCPLSYFLLGVVSVGLTARATLACAETSADRPTATPARAMPPSAGLLR